MKKVTFFTKAIKDGIENADDFEFREEDNYFKQDLSFLKGVKDCFDIYNIKYETYSKFSSDVDYVYLAWSDDLSLEISDLTDRWYPKSVTEKLIRKDRMPIYLKQFGFNCLETKRINSIDDITWNNFIIKPIIGSGGSNAYNYRIPIVEQKYFIDPRDKEPVFSYKRYETRDLFLKDYDSIIDVFRFKSELENKDLRNGYCIQRACMSSEYEIYTIYGVVNSRSNVHFSRAGSTIWKNSREYIGSKFNKLFYNEVPENEFIRNFVKIEKIRNASFGLQLIRMEDGLLYPIDWNFRIKPRMAIVNNGIEELYKQLCHMYDIENDLPETWSDIWYSQHTKKYIQV